MDVAELYMSLVRPNGVPVVGECMADPPFTGQIQVEKWTWELQNDDEIKNEKEEDDRITDHDKMLTLQPTVDLRKRLAKLNEAKGVEARQKSRASAREAYARSQSEIPRDDKDRDQKLADDYDKEAKAADHEEWKATQKAALDFKALSEDLNADERKRYKELDKMVGDVTDAAQQLQEQIDKKDKQAEEENRSYKFSFTKRVDFATTQMLNSMKAGDVFPLGVLTIHQRSSNAGMSLVFTVTNLRLLTYSVRADVGETMTDMKEQWTAEFHSLAYVYKNRKITDGLGSASEAAAKIATQNTVRTFAMKKDLGI